MKHILLQYLRFTIIVFLVFNKCLSQEKLPIMIGATLGVNYNLHNGHFQTVEGNTVCCVAEKGTGLGLVAGAKFFLPINSYIVFMPRVMFEKRGGDFDGIPEVYPIFGNGQLVETATINKLLEISMSSFNADLMGSFMFGKSGVYLAVGPSFSYIPSSSFIETATLSSPAGTKFIDGTTIHQVGQGNLAVNNLQVTLRGGLGAMIKLSKNWFLNPEVLGSYGVTKYYNDWQGHAIQGTIGLMYAFPSNDDEDDNIPVDSMFTLVLHLTDSISGKPLPGLVEIIDTKTGRQVEVIKTSGLEKNYKINLRIGRDYKIEAKARDSVRNIVVSETKVGAIKDVTIKFNKIVVKAVDFGKYDIPFFVTGYYRPNTPDNLEQLFPMKNNELKDANYIEEFSKGSKRHQEYQAYAKTVESLFKSLIVSCVQEVFPEFRKRGLPNEILEIRVSGFADPKPIIGKYIENTEVPYEDSTTKMVTAKHGELLDNNKLSGLRGFYSAKYIEELLDKTKNPDYIALKNEKRVIFKAVEGGVSEMKDDFASKRRVYVEIIRREGE